MVFHLLLACMSQRLKWANRAAFCPPSIYLRKIVSKNTSTLHSWAFDDTSQEYFEERNLPPLWSVLRFLRVLSCNGNWCISFYTKPLDNLKYNRWKWFFALFSWDLKGHLISSDQFLHVCFVFYSHTCRNNSYYNPATQKMNKYPVTHYSPDDRSWIILHPFYLALNYMVNSSMIKTDYVSTTWPIKLIW